MKKTWVPSLGQEDPWGQETATHYSNSCLENCLDRGAWRATIHGVTKSQTLSTQSNWKAARFPFRSAGQEGWVFVRICRDGRTPGGSVLIAVAEGGASGCAVPSVDWALSQPPETSALVAVRLCVWLQPGFPSCPAPAAAGMLSGSFLF